MDTTDTNVNHIPSMETKASPRDGDVWFQRLEEEYHSLIKFLEYNKEHGCDWFAIESDDEGIHWWGRCWILVEYKKFEFEFKLEIPVTYPQTPPEIIIEELDGKTAKMYRGGKICLTDHFFPLWNRNAPKFGIPHLLALGVCI